MNTWRLLAQKEKLAEKEALSWEKFKTAFICGWKDKPTQLIMKVIWTIASFRCPFIHPIIHTWLRCGRSCPVGFSFTLSPGSECGLRPLLRKCTISDQWVRNLPLS